MYQGVEKLKEKSTKGVENTSSRELGKTQKEILNMLTQKFYTIDKIAELRGTSKQSVYKIVTKLRQKGYLTRGFTRGLKNMGGANPPKGLKIRLHGQQFRINIISKTPLYNKIRSSNNIIIFEGHTVVLHEKAILVSCNELVHFYGVDADHAFSESMKFWIDYFLRLQERLNITVLGRKSKILQYNAHFAEPGNELAKDCHKGKEKILIRSEEDGKAWFIIDKSWNVDESETIHPKTAQCDMQEAVSPFFNGLRKRKGFTPEMVLDSLGQLIERDMYYADNLKTHVLAIKQMGMGVDKLRKDISRLNNRMNQKSLTEWF